MLSFEYVCPSVPGGSYFIGYGLLITSTQTTLRFCAPKRKLLLPSVNPLTGFLPSPPPTPCMADRAKVKSTLCWCKRIPSDFLLQLVLSSIKMDRNRNTRTCMKVRLLCQNKLTWLHANKSWKGIKCTFQWNERLYILCMVIQGELTEYSQRGRWIPNLINFQRQTKHAGKPFKGYIFSCELWKNTAKQFQRWLVWMVGISNDQQICRSHINLIITIHVVARIVKSDPGKAFTTEFSRSFLSVPVGVTYILPSPYHHFLPHQCVHVPHV